MSGSVWLLAGATALVPVVAGQSLAQPAAIANPRFTPSDQPLVLTRTVWRNLADGKQIVVRRRYAVRFMRQGDGFLLDGRLLDTSVDAPALLAGMAELERRRGEDGLFPLRLDGAGRIRSGPGRLGQGSGPHAEAADKARAALAAVPLSPLERGESSLFLGQLAAGKALADWPADLFNPASEDQHQQRSIALPGGEQGQVEVRMRVEGHLPGGLPRAIERTVTTVLAGTARISREQWTLDPVEAPSL